MIIPVGEQGSEQFLHRVTRTENTFQIEALDSVIFVPFLAGKE